MEIRSHFGGKLGRGRFSLVDRISGKVDIGGLPVLIKETLCKARKHGAGVGEK